MPCIYLDDIILRTAAKPLYKNYTTFPQTREVNLKIQLIKNKFFPVLIKFSTVQLQALINKQMLAKNKIDFLIIIHHILCRP